MKLVAGEATQSLVHAEGRPIVARPGRMIGVRGVALIAQPLAWIRGDNYPALALIHDWYGKQGCFEMTLFLAVVETGTRDRERTLVRDSLRVGVFGPCRRV